MSWKTWDTEVKVVLGAGLSRGGHSREPLCPWVTNHSYLLIWAVMSWVGIFFYPHGSLAQTSQTEFLKLTSAAFSFFKWSLLSLNKSNWGHYKFHGKKRKINPRLISQHDHYYYWKLCVSIYLFNSTLHHFHISVDPLILSDVRDLKDLFFPREETESRHNLIESLIVCLLQLELRPHWMPFTLF